MDFNRLCINCMREMKPGEKVCGHCGFDCGSYETDPHVLPPFTILNGKYLVGKKIGQGGFGITYIAMNLFLEHRVAIKEFFPGGIVSRDATMAVTVSNNSLSLKKMYHGAKEKFAKEAKTLALLDSMPGSLRVHDYFYENNTAYIVMEYLAGKTLKEYVPEHGGRMDVGEVLDKMRPVMDSLVQLHKKGILHRDISPDNIMVLEDGSLKLFDFGAVKIPAQNYESSTLALIKPGYSPLEQYRTDGSPGPWTDEYALAATIYYCLCGEAPLAAPARAEETDRLVHPGKCGVRIQPATEKVLLKAMSVKKSDRYPDMETFRDELYGSIQPHPSIPVKYFAIAGALAGIVLAGGAGGFLLWKGHNPGTEPARRSSAEAGQENQQAESAGEDGFVIAIETVTDTEETLYRLEVINREGSGNYEAGSIVEISARDSSGDGWAQYFAEWSVLEGNAELADPDEKTTSFVMPAGDVRITAKFNYADWKPKGTEN